MYRAEIKKDGILKHAAEFNLLTEAQNWVSSVNFFVTSRQVSERDVHEYGYDRLNMPPEIPYYEVPVSDIETMKIYTLPPDSIVEYIDISAEVQARKELQESSESFILVNALKSHIRFTNKKKIRTGLWTNETFTAFLTSPVIANAERALNQASWSTYKGLVLQAGAFYTIDEINYIIGLVEQHEQKWQSVLGG